MWKCRLCSYETSRVNINKPSAHLQSSTHTRGVELIYKQVVKLFRLRWIGKELVHQRLFCTSILEFSAILRSQQLLAIEVNCMWARNDIVDDMWVKNAKVAMKIRSRFYRKALHPHLCESIVNIVLSFIPECTKKYKELFGIGEKNFQILNLHMGHQSTRRTMTSSAASDSLILRKKLERKWPNTYRSIQRCVWVRLAQEPQEQRVQH